MKLAADGRTISQEAWLHRKGKRQLAAAEAQRVRGWDDPKCKGLAAEVDHIRAHNGDLRLFWDRSNWQGLCKPCHSRKTLAEQRAKPVQNRWDLDGMPLDPAHHWNKV
jgi:5-methylcytosine-specific restriction endonuclease McrA